jgi:hypothetical protein
VPQVFGMAAGMRQSGLSLTVEIKHVHRVGDSSSCWRHTMSELETKDDAEIETGDLTEELSDEVLDRTGAGTKLCWHITSQ